MARNKRLCSVCAHPFRVELEAMLASGYSNFAVERRSRELGVPVKDITVKRHRMNCSDTTPMDGPPVSLVPGPKIAAIVAAAGPPTGSRDFATLVHARAVELFSGDSAPRVSVRDGLAARQILDRREEKAEDRKFMVNLARLLSGGGAMAPAALIEEGEYKDVTPAEEMAASSLLAPPHLREA